MEEKLEGLIRKSWEKLNTNKKASDVFYKTLFEVDPTLISRLHWAQEQESQSLFKLFQKSVENIHNLERIEIDMNELGSKFHGYGVDKEDYISIGYALICTFRDYVGDVFDKEAEEAWLDFYSEIGVRVYDAGEKESTE